MIFLFISYNLRNVLVHDYNSFHKTYLTIRSINS